MTSNGTPNSENLLSHLSLDGILNRLREQPVPSDSISWSRFSGVTLLALLILLFLSGAFMAFYYSPVPGAAYDSVDYAQFSVPFGDIIRGIHYYAWNFLLIFMGLHAVRAFVVGAYKAPRQLVWISGVLILLFVPFFIITGDLLPWNQKGFWSTQVRLSIIGSVPVVGDFIVRMLKGSPMTGIVALTRFYVLHILFLPVFMMVLVGMHLRLVVHRGLSEPLFQKAPLRKRVPLLPNMINRWLILFTILTILLGFSARYWLAPLGDPADPSDSGYIPKPEWWVLSLNQLVAIFRGPLSVMGTVVIPGGLAGLVLVLPFLDRSPERHPAKRMKVIIPAAAIGLTLLGLSITGYVEHFVGPVE